jgi:hypothetical protein
VREHVEDGVLESEQVREAHEDGTEHVVAPRDLEERIDQLKEKKRGQQRDFTGKPANKIGIVWSTTTGCGQ